MSYIKQECLIYIFRNFKVTFIKQLATINKNKVAGTFKNS